MYEVKIWGSMPWDPTGWELGSEFAQKWWFLLDEGIIRTSNFWRCQRGDDMLVLPERATVTGYSWVTPFEVLGSLTIAQVYEQGIRSLKLVID
jgi:hypothetical protein